MEYLFKITLTKLLVKGVSFDVVGFNRGCAVDDPYRGIACRFIYCV